MPTVRWAAHLAVFVFLKLKTALKGALQKFMRSTLHKAPTS